MTADGLKPGEITVQIADCDFDSDGKLEIRGHIVEDPTGTPCEWRSIVFTIGITTVRVRLQ